MPARAELTPVDLRLIERSLAVLLPYPSPDQAEQRERIASWVRDELARHRIVFRPRGRSTSWLIGSTVHHGMPRVLHGAWRAMRGEAVLAAEYADSKTPDVTVRAQLARAAARVAELGYADLAAALRPPFLRILGGRIVYERHEPGAPCLSL